MKICKVEKCSFRAMNNGFCYSHWDLAPKENEKIEKKLIMENNSDESWKSIPRFKPYYSVNYKTGQVKSKLFKKDRFLTPTNLNRFSKYNIYILTDITGKQKNFKALNPEYEKREEEKSKKKLKERKLKEKIKKNRIRHKKEDIWITLNDLGFSRYEINGRGELRRISKIVRSKNNSTRIINSKLVVPQIRTINKKGDKHCFFWYNLINDNGIRKYTEQDNLLKKYFPLLKKYEKICPVCSFTTSWISGIHPKKCLNPNCSLPSLIFAPKSEIKLMLLQQEYLKDRNPAVMEKMYNILILYSKSMIFKNIHYCFSAPMLAEKSHDTAVAVLEPFLRNSDYRVKKSWGGLIFHKVRQVCFGFAKEEMHDSLDQKVKGKGMGAEKNIERIDLLDSSECNSLFCTSEDNPEKTFFQSDEQNIIADITHNIDLLMEVLNKKFDILFNTLVIIGISHCISRTYTNENIMELFCESIEKYYGISAKKINDVIQAFLLSLYEQLTGI